MRPFKEIKHDYRFTEDDQKRLAALKPLMAAHSEVIMSTLNLWFMGTKGAATSFTADTLKEHVFKTQKV